MTPTVMPPSTTVTTEPRPALEWSVEPWSAFIDNGHQTLEEIWAQDPHASAFASPSLLIDLAARCTDRGDKVFFAIARTREGQCVAVWPLRLQAGKTLGFLNEEFADHCTCLSAPLVGIASLGTGLTETIRRSGATAVILKNVPPWGPTLAAVQAGLADANWAQRSVRATPCPVVRISTEGDIANNIRAEFDRHKRLRSYENRLKREHGFAFEAMDDDGQVAEWAEDFCNLHEWRWNTTHTPSRYRFADARRDIAQNLQSLAADRRLVRFALRLASGRIAMVAALLSADRLVYYHVVTSPAAEESRAGHVLIRLIGLWMAERRISTLDFGVGDEDYKLRYANADERLWRVYAGPFALSRPILAAGVETLIRNSPRLQRSWDRWINGFVRGKLTANVAAVAHRWRTIKKVHLGSSPSFLLGLVFARIWREREIYYRADAIDAQPDPDVVQLRPTQVLSLLEHEVGLSPAARAQIIEFALAGARCFGIVENEKTLSVAWLRPAVASVIPPTVNGDRVKYWCIEQCVTARVARGRGLYPRTLRAILARLPQNDAAIIYTHTFNQASQRGITKAGFVPIATRTRSRWIRADYFTPPASLAILGSYPPPYGGVAIHVQRLMPLLAARGVHFTVYNATSDIGDGGRVIPVFSKRKTWLMQYALTAKESAIYLMSGRLLAWVIGGLMASLRGKRVLVRLRNASLPDWVARNGWHAFWARFALRRVTGVVCVSKSLYECTRALGVAPEKLHWSPGFLPPDVTTITRDGVSPTVWPFIDNHSPIIAANGKVDWYNGQDLYGLDQLVELAARLKADYPRIGIVVCFWDHPPQDQAYLDTLIELARCKGVVDNILFNTVSGEFVPVLSSAELFVRPTNTDGDANSIREAIYLGVPAIASDAVERPAGATLFKTRDIDDFEVKVRSVLSHSSKTARSAPVLALEDKTRIDRYLDLLCNLATGKDLPR
jgi:glycosyltransferase involved in cell wall biosynthesis/CelD/BcsL family acetyltransferase involved in cellulose biosynthesis